MFVTAVCVLFLIKLRWPKKKSIYNVVLFARSRYPSTFCTTGNVLSTMTSAVLEKPSWILRFSRLYFWWSLIDVQRYDYHTNSALMFKKIGKNYELFQTDEIWFDRRVKNAVAMDMTKEVNKQNYLHPSSYSIVYWLFISTARWMVRRNKHIWCAVVLLSEADILKKNYH